jgi:hypothetical protein
MSIIQQVKMHSLLPPVKCNGGRSFDTNFHDHTFFLNFIHVAMVFDITYVFLVGVYFMFKSYLLPDRKFCIELSSLIVSLARRKSFSGL